MKKILTVVLAVVMLTAGVNAAFEKVNTYNNNFSDVTDSNWFAENVKTAYELGFMNGKSEGKFDPNGTVTVAEGITMAARLHAIYNGVEIKPKTSVEEYRLEFDDPEILVDLSKRNSRNTHGVNFKHAEGRIEDGVLIAMSNKQNQWGNYDPQIMFEGIDLKASDYNKVTFRMKVEELEDKNARGNTVEFFFKTNVDPSISADKQINIKFPEGADYSQWFDVVADLGNHEKWTDILTGFRFDPSNNNGIYYIDYIAFSKSENIKSDKWYDIYVDYAVDNGIIGKEEFKSNEYTRNITRAEICNMFAAAIPEDHFAPINDIKGIPDVLRDAENSDVYFTLYKAGVLLGDEKGNFKPEADIKRSEIAAIINRIALPESRVKGTVDFDWAEQGNEYDVEFNDEKSLDRVYFGKATGEIEGGSLVLTATEQTGAPKFDPQVGVDNISIPAEDFSKLKIRIKPEYIGDVKDKKFDFFFKTEADPQLDEKKSLHKDLIAESTLDPFGWYILEVDFTTHKEWKGTITGFRFDPANANGIFTIDYIRLIRQDPLFNATHEELISLGYKSHGMLQDNGYERGLYVGHYEQQKVDKSQRMWQDYCEEGVSTPVWDLGPWWNGHDLWENRVEGDKYTLTDDKGINTIIYNPDEKSLSLRVDATKIYEGKPHIIEEYKWWPHLLLNQQYSSYPVDPVKNSAAADRIFVELDMRITDFKDTINPAGTNVCQFPLYFYFITDKAPTEKIWFGLSLMNGLSCNASTNPTWAPDSAAHQFMYGIPQATVYGGMENSFNPEKGKMVVGDEWKHIRVDITPHIERCIEWANRDRAFGVEVTKEDMYFGGCNIGFEIHGNYDCTIEIKNLDMVAYNKD